MKPLDKTDIFHDRLITYYTLLTVFLLPAVVAGLVADEASQFFKDFEAIIRWPAILICGFITLVFCFLLSIVIGSLFEDGLNKIRKLMGREPIGRTMRKHEEEAKNLNR